MGIWPQFLAGHKVGRENSAAIDRLYSPFQLVAVVEKPHLRVVGVSNAVPLGCHVAVEDLPNEGWDWAVKAAVDRTMVAQRDHDLCILSISVLPEFRRHGVGTMFIKEYLRTAHAMGMQRVVAPVRPVTTHHVIDAPMSEFINLRSHDGRHIDPWIRAHEAVGGKVISICWKSMTVAASLKQWRSWGADITETTRKFVLPGCIVPVITLPEEDSAVYVEPNIWMLHETGV
jgi:GNAT superfamily N-acetyltransferase